MKFMLNGALTIGTFDGANVEILEEVGEENFYLFGAKVEDIAALWRAGYDPRARIAENPELSKVIELLGSERLAPRGELDDLVRVLMDEGDRYLLALDYPSYVEAQARVARDYLDVHAWTRRSILNTARCGKFSSDRTVREYASEIWGASAIPQRAPRVRAL
jgi:starch phosphorylase